MSRPQLPSDILRKIEDHGRRIQTLERHPLVAEHDDRIRTLEEGVDVSFRTINLGEVSGQINIPVYDANWDITVVATLVGDTMFNIQNFHEGVYFDFILTQGVNDQGVEGGWSTSFFPFPATPRDLPLSVSLVVGHINDIVVIAPSDSTLYSFAQGLSPITGHCETKTFIVGGTITTDIYIPPTFVGIKPFGLGFDETKTLVGFTGICKQGECIVDWFWNDSLVCTDHLVENEPSPFELDVGENMMDGDMLRPVITAASEEGEIVISLANGEFDPDIGPCVDLSLCAIIVCEFGQRIVTVSPTPIPFEPTPPPPDDEPS